MKFTKAFTIAALLGTTTAQDLAEEPEAENMDKFLNTIHGVKSFYSGYYKALYKQKMPAAQAECLNEETIDNMMAMKGLFFNPIETIQNGDLAASLNIFAEGTEVMENLVSCKFEQSAMDIMAMCKADEEACAVPKLTENLTQNMFVLMGKLTEAAELIKDFPAEDEEEYEAQMYEFGSDAGTLLRTVFDFEAPRDEEPAQKNTHTTHTTDKDTSSHKTKPKKPSDEFEHEEPTKPKTPTKPIKPTKKDDETTTKPSKPTKKNDTKPSKPSKTLTDEEIEEIESKVPGHHTTKKNETKPKTPTKKDDDKDDSSSSHHNTPSNHNTHVTPSHKDDDDKKKPSLKDLFNHGKKGLKLGH